MYRESMVLVGPRHSHFDLPDDPFALLRRCSFIRFDSNNSPFTK